MHCVGTRTHEDTNAWHILEQEPRAVGTDPYEIIVEYLRNKEDSFSRATTFISKSIDQPQLLLGGRLISAVWDPWEDWLNGDLSAPENPENFT